ncbi:MAG: hypothetical protein WBM44_24755 [Waterburya sp.]
MLVTIGIITLPSNVAKRTLAIGCDTYERIRGEIGGSCTGGTTEYSRELWLERYRVCLDQQLSREISLYDNKVETSYTEWNKDSEPDIKLDKISLEDKNTPPLSISQMQSSTYRANNDLCN